MTWLDDIDGPTDAELRAIEACSDLLAAEMALVDAEVALFARPTKATAAAYLRSLLDLVDLHDFAGHDPLLIRSRRPSSQPTAKLAGAVR